MTDTGSKASVYLYGESRSHVPQSDIDVEAECGDTAAIAREALLPSGMDSDQY